MFNLIERQWFHYIMKIRETSYFPSWIGRQTKLKPTNRAHILDIFNTYYGNRVKSDSIVFHRGSFNWAGGQEDMPQAERQASGRQQEVLQEGMKEGKKEGISE